MDVLRDKSQETFEAPLPSDVNERACQVVLSGVVRYPQDSRGNVFIAKEVIDGSTNEKRRNLTINDLSRIQPDGAVMADTINKIHEQFQIPRRVTPDEAETTVVDFAIGALDRVRLYAVWEAEKQGIPHEDILKQPVLKRYGDEKRITPHWIDREVTDTLDNFLKSHESVRQEVSLKLNVEAKEVQVDSRNQQQRAANNEVQRLG